MRPRLIALRLTRAIALADGAGMIPNMVAMETFGVRDGKIDEIQGFPFVTFQYGQGDGWTPAKAR